MAKCYFELRKQSAKGTDSIAADVMRHLHARQHLGTAVVICDNPVGYFSASRKQWLKLTRTIQKLRAGTLNADKILKHTHTITHMQQMRFSHKMPLYDPGADVYFMQPGQCDTLPLHCYGVYCITPVVSGEIYTIVGQLPAEALVIDYNHGNAWVAYGLQPKTVLEAQVRSEWLQVEQFLQAHDIDASSLIYRDMHDIDAMDNALDTLLNVSHRFMRVANDFQRSLELARPLRMHRTTREQYDALVLLAHRVQALSPGTFTQQFLRSYNEDDTFFLYDAGRQTVYRADNLMQLIGRHQAAGRFRLAEALYAKAAAL